MAIFAKKSESEPRTSLDLAPPASTPAAAGSKGHFGIAEAIQLLRTLSANAEGGQSGDLVIRVVRAQDRIAAVQAQIADLEKQLETQRREVASLEADLKETTNVKERLQAAEKSAGGVPSFAKGENTPLPPLASLPGKRTPPLGSATPDHPGDATQPHGKD
jgi:TolA-binding protein